MSDTCNSCNNDSKFFIQFDKFDQIVAIITETRAKQTNLKYLHHSYSYIDTHNWLFLVLTGQNSSKPILNWQELFQLVILANNVCIVCMIL